MAASHHLCRFPLVVSFYYCFFSDYEEHLKSFNVLRNGQCTLCIHSGCASRHYLMWNNEMKNLSKCFSATLLSYKAAPRVGLSDHYGFRQEPGGGIRFCASIEYHVCVQGPKMSSVRRHAIEADSNSIRPVTQ